MGSQRSPVRSSGAGPRGGGLAPRSARAATLLLALLGACRAPVPVDEGSARAPELALHDDWDTCSPVAFERWLEQALPAQSSTRVPPPVADELAAALASTGERSVRAAVVLARTRRAEAAERLLGLLEARLSYEERSADAAAVVAARGLLHAPVTAGLLGRLDALAVGPRAHPDLEVRVECAATALALGSDAAIPFLLQVLRLGTPAGRAEARDFEAPATSAWARARAAEALARRAGLKNTYPTDGALAEREAFAERLRRALARSTTLQ